jgi:large subunit ribosomal protein L25
MTATIQAQRLTGQIDEPTAFQFIRRKQRVPAILSGKHDAEQILSLETADVEQAIGDDDEAALVRLDVEGESIWARVSGLDRDPLKQTIGHVELTRLPEGEPVAVDVPVEVLSKSAFRARGKVIQELRKVRIEGPVELLPDVLRIDARRLQPDESITVADLTLPDGCRPVDVPLETAMVVAVPKTELVGKEERQSSG